MSRIFTVTTADKSSAVNGTIEIRVSGPKVSNVVRYEIHREETSTPTPTEYNGLVVIRIATGDYNVDFFNLWVNDNRESGGADSALGVPINNTEVINVSKSVGEKFTIYGSIAPSPNQYGAIPLTRLNYTFNKELSSYSTNHCTIDSSLQGELTLDDYNPISDVSKATNLAGINFNFEITPTADNFVVALEIAA